MCAKGCPSGPRGKYAGLCPVCNGRGRKVVLIELPGEITGVIQAKGWDHGVLVGLSQLRCEKCQNRFVCQPGKKPEILL